jgi:hypothetical protein
MLKSPDSWLKSDLSARIDAFTAEKAQEFSRGVPDAPDAL